MCPFIKDFLCKESQDLISIHDYQPSELSVKYKAKRNGLPVILQISPVPENIDIHADLREFSLCQGVLENEATKVCSFHFKTYSLNLLVEKLFTEVEIVRN